ERQPARAQRIERDVRERDGEQDLLPRGDRRQRRAAHAGGVERRHDRVVQREADEEEIERDDGTPPDRRGRDGEEQRVESELDDRHGREGTAGGDARPRPPSYGPRSGPRAPYPGTSPPREAAR